MKTKILFVCHGNICRSPMAEFVMKEMVRKNGVAERFEIASAATSTEEIGNDIYPPAKRTLHSYGIPFTSHSAHQMTRQEYEYYDHITLMDNYNRRYLERRLGPDTLGKISLLLDWTDTPGEVADPWYSGDFELTFRQVTSGCTAIIEAVR